jgi:hypothetical protein
MGNNWKAGSVWLVLDLYMTYSMLQFTPYNWNVSKIPFLIF